MNPESIKSFVTVDGRCTWTMTTNGYKYYTLNLLVWLRDIAKVPWKFLIVCCDSESLAFFRREGIPCVGYKAQEQKGQQQISGFGTDSFAKWNRKKMELFQWFCGPEARSVNIRESLYLDGDIVVREDPWPVLSKVEGGIVCQCDCVGQENHSDCGALCSGVVLLRHTKCNPDVFQVVQEEWIAADRQDQPYIRNRIAKLGEPLRTLDRSLFGNGHWQMSKLWKTTPWILLHYNYRVGDTKKAAMKVDGHWKIPY